MKVSNLALGLAFIVSVPLLSDTLYQTTPQGRQVVIQRDAIVVKDNSSTLVYKHFDLKEHRVVKVALNKGSLSYSVVTASRPERQQIVDIWKRFGYKATITDQAEKTTRVFDAYLDFYPPGGRGSLLESVPPRTSITLLRDDGGADDVEFGEIDRVEFSDGRIKVTLRGGQVKEGRFLRPTDRPVETRVLGITDRYDPASEDVFDFSLPLERLKQIQFEP